jgi:hypothetical protein
LNEERPHGGTAATKMPEEIGNGEGMSYSSNRVTLMGMRREVGSLFVAVTAVLAQCNAVLAAPAGQRADGQATGQVRSRPAPEPPTAAPPVNQPPSTGPTFQSTLKFDPRHAGDEQRVVPLPVDRFGAPFGFVTPLLSGRGIRLGGMGGVPLAYPLPSGAAPGGVQLDVQPWRAQVYVDGSYVGLVSDFTGYYHHLEVSGGPHVIAIVTPGYEPLILDLLVSPGRVTTYRGTLSPASGR